MDSAPSSLQGFHFMPEPVGISAAVSVRLGEARSSLDPVPHGSLATAENSGDFLVTDADRAHIVRHIKEPPVSMVLVFYSL